MSKYYEDCFIELMSLTLEFFLYYRSKYYEVRFIKFISMAFEVFIINLSTKKRLHPLEAVMTRGAESFYVNWWF
jgi:inner membrane protein involved in colicin E2 resistance